MISRARRGAWAPVAAAAVALIALAAPACSADSSGGVPDAGPVDAAPPIDATGDRGIVRVFWNVDQGMRDCAAAGAVRVAVTMTRDRDGLQVAEDFDCEDRMGVLPTVPMDGVYLVRGEIQADDGSVLDDAEETMQFDSCDSTIVTPDGTVCGRELALWDFRTQ